MPAKAGTQLFAECDNCLKLDSRLRGNDNFFEQEHYLAGKCPVSRPSSLKA